MSFDTAFDYYMLCGAIVALFSLIVGASLILASYRRALLESVLHDKTLDMTEIKDRITDLDLPVLVVTSFVIGLLWPAVCLSALLYFLVKGGYLLLAKLVNVTIFQLEMRIVRKNKELVLTSSQEEIRQLAKKYVNK
jgi:hypothetical protein